MKLKSVATLRALMNQAGLSTRALAHKAGLSHHSTIDHLLSGRRDTCDPVRATGIATALGAPSELLWESEDAR
ncbi:helix-turn-helix domain-containing protein [Nocardia africana]